MFLQRTHVLDYFPSAPDLDVFGFGKINIETFLFLPSFKRDELILDILFWVGSLLRVWTLPDAQLLYPK